MRIRFFDEEQKKMTVIINGKEVTNPVARWLIAGAGILFGLVVLILVVLIILPLVGVTLAGSLIVAALALVLAIPVLPFILLGKWIENRSDPGTDAPAEVED